MRHLLYVTLFLIASTVTRATDLEVTENDFVIKNFKFKDGSSLSSLKLHYLTLGKLKKNESGKALNAVLVMHGTGGAGRSLISDNFSGELFRSGQLLDADKYYIILPDGIGHGQSSKPSDGLHARFPKYDYDDMVESQYRLVTEGLGINHLRLVMGTSMGGMHTWIWGESHPEFMDALLQ